MPVYLDDAEEFALLSRIPPNQTICHFLQENSPSAHSDLAEEIAIVMRSLPPYRAFCPNLRNYAYIIYYTKADAIFALVMGMNEVILRIPDDQVQEALSERGQHVNGISHEWMLFPVFRLGLSRDACRKRLQRLIEIAYQYALLIEPVSSLLESNSA